METNSKPGCIQLSSSSAGLLRRSLPPDLVLKPRGEIAVKGKGRMSTFFVEYAERERAADPAGEGNGTPPALKPVLSSRELQYVKQDPANWRQLISGLEEGTAVKARQSIDIPRSALIGRRESGQAAPAEVRVTAAALSRSPSNAARAAAGSGRRGPNLSPELHAVAPGAPDPVDAMESQQQQPETHRTQFLTRTPSQPVSVEDEFDGATGILGYACPLWLHPISLLMQALLWAVMPQTPSPLSCPFVDAPLPLRHTPGRPTSATATHGFGSRPGPCACGSLSARP